MSAHGTNSSYTTDHCRCADCKKAHADYQRDFYSKRVEQRLAELGLTDAPCAWCGDRTSVKEFDHIDPSKKTELFSNLIRYCSMDRVRAELPLINVLCGDESVNRCHRRKRSVYRYEGAVVLLHDGGMHKRSHPVRLNGTWLGWTVAPQQEEVKTLISLPVAA